MHRMPMLVATVIAASVPALAASQLPEYDSAKVCGQMAAQAPEPNDPAIVRLCTGMERTARATLAARLDLYPPAVVEDCIGRIARNGPANGIDGSYVLLLRCVREKSGGAQ